MPRPISLDLARKNRLLAHLPPEQLERWRAQMRLVAMPLGHTVFESNAEVKKVYFPIDSIVSLLYVLENGASAEIAVVGNDGVVGVSLFMGGVSTSSRAVVQSAGSALELPSSTLMKDFEAAGAVLHLLLRYTQALITQMAQTAVCNRHHAIRQQLCRWLLLSLDRLEGNELSMTQELIGDMLGVRRPSVNAEARRLQKMGAIEYHRGHIVVLDRSKLEACTCECYSVVKRETDRLLPQPDARS